MGRKITKVIGHQLFVARPSVWWPLMKKNQIDFKFWHKAFLITLISALVWPLQKIQSIFYGKKIRSIDLNKNPPVFILGHWRSGTTHLHYILHQDPQFGTLSNYQAFLFNLALLSKTKLKWILNPLMPPTRPQDNTAFDLYKPAEEEQPFSTMSSRSGIHSWNFPKNQNYFKKYNLFQGISKKEKRAWQKSYVKCLQNISLFNDHKKLVLKNPHNTSRVKELLELFPNAKFVYIHRKPEDVILSTIHLYKKMVSSQYLQESEKIDQKKLIFENYKNLLGKYEEERHLIPDGNLVELSYEDLSQNPKTTIKRLYRELGLLNFKTAWLHQDKYLNSVKRYKKNSYQKIDPALIEKIHNELHFEKLDRLCTDPRDLSNLEQKEDLMAEV